MVNYIRKHCLFCGSKEDVEELYPQTFRFEDLTPEVFSARRSTEHFHYTIVRCRNCGLVFSRDILSDDVLAHLYTQSKVTFAEYTEIIRKDYWRCLGPHVRHIEKGVALEIGCSSGFFLEELLSRGFTDVYGCEPSLEAQRMASPAVQKNITVGFFRDGMYQANTFDLVCSFQTLDHLSDPLEVLRIAHGVLKPGGIMLVDVPQRYHYYTVVKHILIALRLWFAGWEREYSAGELERLLRRHSFSIVSSYGEWFNPPMWYRMLRRGLLRAGITLPMYPRAFAAIGKAFGGLRETLSRRRFALYTTVVVGTIARKE